MIRVANRRCFAADVVESDRFTDMPLSAQALYLHLGMATDDDGFVVSPRRIQRAIGAADDDLRILAARGFVIPFESGVMALTHHRVNNLLRNDRYKPTSCVAEWEQLKTLPTRAYSLGSGEVLPAQGRALPSGNPTGNQMATAGCHNPTEPNQTERNRTERNTSGKPDHSPAIREVVEYLNQKAGKSHSATAKVTVRCITARLNEGYSVADCKRVVDIKARQWKNDTNMNKFLRPETLFGSKFDAYLNERVGGANDVYGQYAMQRSSS